MLSKARKRIISLYKKEPDMPPPPPPPPQPPKEPDYGDFRQRKKLESTRERNAYENKIREYKRENYEVRNRTR